MFVQVDGTVYASCLDVSEVQEQHSDCRLRPLVVVGLRQQTLVEEQCLWSLDEDLQEEQQTLWAWAL